MNLNEKQNQDSAKLQLAAQRYYYNKSKEYRTLKVVLAIIAMIGIPIAIISFPEYAIGFSGASAIILILNEFVLAEFEKKYRTLGARIQELFDTNLFGLKDWSENIEKRILGTDKIISDGARKLKNKKGLDNWYGWINDSYFDEKLEILFSQYSNLDWDHNQRKVFQRYLVALLVAVLLGLMITPIVLSLYFWEAFLHVFLPASPLIIFLSRNIIKNKVLIASQEDTMMSIYKAFENSSLENISIRSIQDVIFKNRLNGESVPNFIYDNIRDDYEEHMKAVLEDFHKKNLKLN